MGQKMKFVATLAMDDYFQNYAAGPDFFTIDDFIQRCGNVAADFYMKQWKMMYDELRQERREEVVGFDPSTLSEQLVKVKKEGIDFIGTLEKPAMSLPYDKQSSGFSNVFDAKTGKELERSNINETWQYSLMPYTDRMFFRFERDKIKIFTKSALGLQEVRILYVPSITIGSTEDELPDGMVNYVVMTTVSQMRQLAQGKVVKTSIDGNPNMIMESEINKESVK
jgi:hypothetical protein